VMHIAQYSTYVKKTSLAAGDAKKVLVRGKKQKNNLKR